MIEIRKELPATGNAYVIFGFEAIQARPNLDPYTSTLRTNDETMQVFTSDVHIKHHARRGLKAYAAEKKLPHPDQAVFYEKEDEAGNPCDFAGRLKKIRDAYEIAKGKEDRKDALRYCLDLPLFGYVHAEKNQNFNVTNAVNTLFRPVTFHGCKIYSLGRNNAFPGVKNNVVSNAAGSAAVDSLEYGFFLSLWEINLNMLRVNAAEHMLMDWKKNGAKGWLEAFVNGLWKAYSTDRYPSFTQRSQFAQFALGWMPEKEPEYINPADLYGKLDEREICSHADALKALEKVMPDFLKSWQCDKNTVFLKHAAQNFTVNLPG